jgi:hypothetical protein
MYRLAVAVVALSTACSASLPERPATPDHPANPQGPAGLVQSVPRLVSDTSDQPAESVLVPPSEGPHHHGEASPKMEGITEPGTDHKGVVYSCPMHPEVQSTRPGTCPKCGMALAAPESKP